MGRDGGPAQWAGLCWAGNWPCCVVAGAESDGPGDVGQWAERGEPQGGWAEALGAGGALGAWQLLWVAYKELKRLQQPICMWLECSK